MFVILILPDAAKKHGRTVVIVSHDHRIAEVADRVLWLEDGRLQETGELGRGSPAASPSRELPLPLYNGPGQLTHNDGLGDAC